MRSVKHAILLLAGVGRRMGELTLHQPKCLLEINGVSFLERSLRSLAECGIQEAVLVVGYRSDQIQRFVGGRYAGINIKYVHNDRFAETNTGYSLWLASKHLDSNCFVLEGDILVETSVLQYMLRSANDKSVWAATPVSPRNCEGILLRKNAAGFVTGVRLVRPPEHRPVDLSHKCAGIQLLTADLTHLLTQKLHDTIAQGEIQKYADLALGQVLAEDSMVLCSLEGMRWAEVDSPEDYHEAQKLFLSPNLGEPVFPNMLTEVEMLK